MEKIGKRGERNKKRELSKRERERERERVCNTTRTRKFHIVTLQLHLKYVCGQ